MIVKTDEIQEIKAKFSQKLDRNNRGTEGVVNYLIETYDNIIKNDPEMVEYIDEPVDKPIKPNEEKPK